jgi:hypothetical protein
MAFQARLQTWETRMMDESILFFTLWGCPYKNDVTYKNETWEGRIISDVIFYNVTCEQKKEMQTQSKKLNQAVTGK